MTSTDIPDGFEPHFRKSPLTDPWEPLYSRRTPEAVILGLRLGTPHTNARGFAHGGLIAALMHAKTALLKPGSSIASRGLSLAWLLSFVVLVVLGTYHHMISFNQWY